MGLSRIIKKFIWNLIGETLVRIMAVEKYLSLSKHSAFLVHLFCLVQIEVSNRQRGKAW